MPTLAKILSEEEEKLELAEVENITPEFIQDFGNQENIDDVVFRIFAPHAHTAKNQYEERKKQQFAKEKWLATIVNNQNALLNTQSQVKSLVERLKTQNTNGNSNAR